MVIWRGGDPQRTALSHRLPNWLRKVASKLVSPQKAFMTIFGRLGTPVLFRVSKMLRLSTRTNSEIMKDVWGTLATSVSEYWPYCRP